MSALRVARPALNPADIEFNRATVREQKALGDATWRPAIHGCHVLVNAQGKVCATVRELGMARPKKDRVYSARIEGVQWWSMAPSIGRAGFRPQRHFATAKSAMAAVEIAREAIRAEPDGDDA